MYRIVAIFLVLAAYLPRAHADGEDDGRRLHGFVEHALFVGTDLTGTRTFTNANVAGLRTRAMYGAGATYELGASRVWSGGLGLQAIFAGEGSRVAIAPRIQRELSGPWSAHGLVGISVLQEGEIADSGASGPDVLVGAGLHHRWVAVELVAHVTHFEDATPDVASPDLVLPAGTDVAIYGGISLSDPPVWIALGIEAVAALVFVATFPVS